MPKKVLVASTHPAFRDLLRISLEESRRYTVSLLPSMEQADAFLADDPHDVLILDANVQSEVEISPYRSLCGRFPELRTLVFPPDNDPRHPFLSDLRYDTCLKKPFYLPELLAALDGLTGQLGPSGWRLEEQPDPLQHLQTLLSQTRAMAALLLRNGKVEMVAGQMDANAAAEAESILTRSWQAGRQTDLIRYARLQSTGAEILLYAVTVEESLLLALVFSPVVILKEARAAAQVVARELRAIQPAAAALMPFVPPQVEIDPPAGWQEDRPDEEESLEEMELLEESEDPRMVELLSNLPPPDPSQAAPDPSDQWLPEEQFAAAGQDFTLPWEEETPAPPPDSLEVPPHPATQARTIPQGGVEDTRPSRANAGPPPGSTLTEEYRQAYTCILIPQRPEVLLEGNLCTELERWIPQFCQTFGWRLESLAVHPTHLIWTILVAPAVSPGHLVRILREQSTLRLSSLYPDQAQMDPDTDFWSPGYLIVSGRLPPEDHLIADFIRQTRRRQGFAQN